jgi:hypothetical protein
MLRSIMHVSLLDRVSNEAIRERAGVPSIRAMIRRARLAWLGRVMNMDEDRWPKVVLCGWLREGCSRKPGRPPLGGPIKYYRIVIPWV